MSYYCPKFERRKKINIEPQWYQYAFLENESKFTGMISGIGAGKTWAGGVKAIKRITDGSGTNGLIGANSYPQLENSTLPPFLAMLDEYGLRYELKMHKHRLYVWNGKQKILINVLSLEKYNLIRGLEIGWFWVDEAAYILAIAWKILIGRLRCKKSKKLEGWITTTPNGYNWLYDEFAKKKRKNYYYIRVHTRDNKYLVDGYVESLEESYDTEMQKQEMAGEFMSLGQAQVFYMFDPKINVIEKYDIDEQLPALVAMDFNVTPFCVSIAQLKEDVIYVFKEIQLKNAHTKQMVKEIKDYIKSKILQNRSRQCFNDENQFTEGDFPIKIYPDPSCICNKTAAVQSDEKILEKAFGLLNIFMKKQVLIKTSATIVNNLLEKKRLLISKNCPGVIKSLEQTSYIPGSAFQIKKNNDEHFSDGIRYMCDYIYPIHIHKIGYGRIVA